MMSQNKFSKTAFVLFIVLLVGNFSCTSDFGDKNVDSTKLTVLGENEIPFLFSKAQSSASYAFWRYQVAQNLFSDLYSQYYATTATYFPSDRNVIRMDWMRWHWSPIYTDVVPQLKSIFENTEESSAEYALANIMWVYAFHRLTDYYGPVPYFNAGEPAKTVPYDSQEDIYNDFFKRLDASLAVLQGKTGETPFGTYDLLYGGDVSKWIKFANTLKLRLAMRISDVSPSEAKSYAEQAVSSGVMESIDDDAMMYKTEAGSDVNGLAGISVWNEFRMSAAMESVLKGYDDPRIGIYFQPSLEGEYNGLRNGLNPQELGEEINSNNYNSNVGTRWVTGSGSAWARVGETPQNIMHSAEAYFNRAEGALNGWSMGGSAQDLYESGIKASMNQWGIADDAAITAYINSTNTPIPPEDFMSSPALNDAPIKWSSDAETQKLQIANQKWLALFPDGIEAWADNRRSDRPILYPVVHNENSDLEDGKRPNRIPFIDQEVNTNGPAVEQARSLLDGPDKPSTKLWWDKN